MRMPFIIEACQDSEVKTIVNGINAYNLSHVPALAEAWTPLNFVIKDESGNAIAGILGGIGYWNGLDIRILWVAESYRNKGLGSQLLHHIEMAARQKGATISMLDTFDFQAENFYIKNGYMSVGEIKDFPKGHRRIYFSKSLV